MTTRIPMDELHSNSEGSILIPDISGFTRFINNTEAIHSAHIIGELLQIIADVFSTHFEISEIEGDAVLLYRLGKPLSWKVLKEKLLDAFYQFHGHLNVYKRDVICTCGACSTASSLSLKFIIHYGVIGFYNVRQFKKLIGSDIIVAHRLLKNSVNLQEYILISDRYARHDQTTPSIVDEFLSKSESLDETGSITYHYKNIDHWLKGVPVPSERKALTWYDIKPYITFQTNARPTFVLDALTDPGHRVKWMRGVKAIKLKGGHQINRVKTVHDCILPMGSLTIRIQDYRKEKNEMVLVENSKMRMLGIEVNLIYRITITSSEFCQVSLGLDFQKSDTLFYPLRKMIFRLIIKIQISGLKKYLSIHH